MIRVLHVMRSLQAGGIGTFILNVYRTINRDEIQFDFAITHGGMGEYGDEIIQKGGHIYFISTEGNKRIIDGIRQIGNLYKLCKQNRYDVIHCHYYFANAYFLGIAKLAGIKKRVSHCHNNTIRKLSFFRKLFNVVSREILLKTGTDFLGCSDAATIFLYGKKAFERGIAKTLYNGIDYSFWDKSQVNIELAKEKYNVKDEHLFLFVGRLEDQKNPLFALDVFKQIYDRLGNALFLFVGEGSFKPKVEEFLSLHNLQKNVRLLPANSNIRELQAISEVMIAPSLWEGLSIAFIEAQKMQTMVYASDQVPSEVDMGYCRFLPLNNAIEWAEKIIYYINNEDKNIKLIKPERFDVRATTKNLINIYKN